MWVGCSCLECKREVTAVEANLITNMIFGRIGKNKHRYNRVAYDGGSMGLPKMAQRRSGSQTVKAYKFVSLFYQLLQRRNGSLFILDAYRS